MGQYYLAVNPGKKEYLHPHDFDNGMKLMEHSWAGNDFVRAVESLLSPGGRWHGDRIVWAGDYMDEGLFLEHIHSGYENPEGDGDPTLYDVAGHCFARLRPLDVEVPSSVASGKPFLLNTTKKEYVDIKSLPVDDEGSSVHPLPLLASSGNGRGGGDYEGTRINLVGSWAGDEILTADTVPENFVRIRPDFIEGTPLLRLVTGDEDTLPEHVPEAILKLHGEGGAGAANAFVALCACDAEVPFSEKTLGELRSILRNAKGRTLEKAVKILAEAYSVVGFDRLKLVRNMTDESLCGNGYLDIFKSPDWRAMNFISGVLLRLMENGEFDAVMKFIETRVGGKNLEYMEKENVRGMGEVLSKLTAHMAEADDERNGGGGAPVL